MKCSALKWGPDGRTLMRKRRTGFTKVVERLYSNILGFTMVPGRLFPGTPKSCFIINYKYHHVSANYRFYTWNSCFLSPNAGGSKIAPRCGPWVCLSRCHKMRRFGREAIMQKVSDIYHNLVILYEFQSK